MAERLEVFVKLVKGLSEAPVSDSVREACRAASEALEEKIPGYRERLQRSIALAPFEYLDAERAAPMVRPGLYSEKKRAASKANAKKAQAARRVWDSKEEGVRIRARRYSKRKKILQGLANPRRLMRVKALQRVLEAMQGEDPEILRHPALAEAVNAATRDSDAEVRMKAEACLEVVSRQDKKDICPPPT